MAMPIFILAAVIILLFLVGVIVVFVMVGSSDEDEAEDGAGKPVWPVLLVVAGIAIIVIAGFMLLASGAQALFR